MHQTKHTIALSRDDGELVILSDEPIKLKEIRSNDLFFSKSLRKVREVDIRGNMEVEIGGFLFYERNQRVINDCFYKVVGYAPANVHALFDMEILKDGDEVKVKPSKRGKLICEQIKNERRKSSC